MAEQLADLLEDCEEIDVSVATGILKRVLRIDRTTGNLRPIGDFDDLSGTAKVAVQALGYRAAVALEKLEANGFKSEDIQAWSGMPKGTVGRELAGLVDERLLVRIERGVFDVPPHAIRKLCIRIKDELDGIRA